MEKVGILAYGSLRNNLGPEIAGALARIIENVITPFKIEFARSSNTHNGAPTLIPVETGGQEVFAQILVLNEKIGEEEAKSMLWRRETGQISSGKKYTRPDNPGKDHVLIERLENFQGVGVVFYTKIGSNIEPLTPQILADLSINSCQLETIRRGLDGINYLNNAKKSGIKTPLMGAYEAVVLSKLGAKNLEDALSIMLSERLREREDFSQDTDILKKPPIIENTGESVIEKKLDTVLEKIAVSKLDNSFLLSFSVISVVFTLSTILLTAQVFRQILTLAAILYFIVSFYVGYFKGAIRDNWGFRIWGWILMLYSTAVILTGLFGLLLLQLGAKFPFLFLYGVAIILISLASFSVIGFIKGICNTTPVIRKHLASMSPIQMHYLSPFVSPAIDERSSKPTYIVLLVILIIGIVLTIL